MKIRNLLVLAVFGLSWGLTLLEPRVEAVEIPECSYKFCDTQEFERPCRCPEWTDDREGAWCGTWDSIGQHGCWWE